MFTLKEKMFLLSLVVILFTVGFASQDSKASTVTCFTSGNNTICHEVGGATTSCFKDGDDTICHTND